MVGAAGIEISVERTYNKIHVNRCRAPSERSSSIAHCILLDRQLSNGVLTYSAYHAEAAIDLPVRLLSALTGEFEQALYQPILPATRKL